MNLPQVVAKVLLALERLVANTVAATDSAGIVAVVVSVHVTLQLILAIEELGRKADATLQDLGRLPAGWDGADGWTNNQCCWGSGRRCLQDRCVWDRVYCEETKRRTVSQRLFFYSPIGSIIRRRCSQEVIQLEGVLDPIRTIPVLVRGREGVCGIRVGVGLLLSWHGVVVAQRGRH